MPEYVLTMYPDLTRPVGRIHVSDELAKVLADKEARFELARSFVYGDNGKLTLADVTLVPIPLAQKVEGDNAG